MFNDSIPWRQAQRVSRDFELVLAVVAAGSSDDGFQLALLSRQGVEVGVFFGVSGVNLFKTVFGLEHLFHTALHRFANGLLGAQLRLLGQIPDLQTGHGKRFALDFLVDACHDFQQRGFARTVQAQHADFGARKEAQGNVFQDMAFGRHDFADAVHGENVLGHGMTLRACAPQGVAMFNTHYLTKL